MTYEEIAASILACLGGKNNIRANALCMTRLRVHVATPTLIDAEGIENLSGVLGLLQRNDTSYEIVCRPTKVQNIFSAFCNITGLPNDLTACDSTAGAQKPTGARMTNKPALDVHVHDAHTNAQNVPDKHTYQAHNVSDAVRPYGQLHTKGATGAFQCAGLSEAEELTRMLLLSEPGAHEAGEQKSNTPAQNTKQPLRQAGANDTLLNFDVVDDEHAQTAYTHARKGAHDELHVLVLNGPNINLLGMREPGIYGNQTYSHLIDVCETSAQREGFASCVCFQSNHEGELVDAIQQARGVYEGIVFNPAAYTHTSIALLDALKAVNIPTVEVHISDVPAREDFRQFSYIRPACIATVMGKGIDGYAEAMHLLAQHIRKAHTRKATDKKESRA